MKIEVMNQKDVEAYAMEANFETSVIISIASRGMPSAIIIPCNINNIVDVLYLNFNDTDDNRLEFGGIDKTDAKKIKDFVLKYEEDYSIDKIIVNCEAGQSRSSGVAAAILKYMFNDDSQIFDNHKYIPNMLCYRTVLNELMM
jgi:predicted protein tyrosine phosphatase